MVSSPKAVSNPQSALRSAIRGTGSAFPSRVLTNLDLEKQMDTSDEWISTRTGIKERRIVEIGNPAETSSALSYRASLQALEMAGLTSRDIDFILYATATPETLVPSTACWLQQKLEAFQAPAMDINAACAGFVFALSTADSLIRSGTAKNVLVVGADLLSTIANWQDRNTCILFGDGAGAAIVSAVSSDRGAGIIGSCLGSDGRLHDLFEISAGGSREPVTVEAISAQKHKATMRGKEMFKEAVTHMALMAKRVTEENGLSLNQVDWILAHQANLRILEAVAKRLDLPSEKFLVNIDRFGNTSSATIPTLLDENVRNGKIKPGHKLLFIGLGAGLTFGANLVEWTAPLPISSPK